MWLTIKTEARLALSCWRSGAAVAVILAIGLAIAVTLLNLVDSLVWRPLRVPAVERLVAFESNTANSSTWQPLRLSPAEIHRLQLQQTPGVTHIAGVRSTGASTTLLSAGGRTVPVRVATVTDGFFALFGEPALPVEHITQGIEGAVVSETLWAQTLRPAGLRIGGIASIEAFDPGTFGTRPRPIRIAGVAPPGFHFPGDTQLWLAANGGEAHFRQFSLVGQLESGVKPDSLTTESESFLQSLQPGSHLRARALRETMRPQEAWLLLLLLSVTAGLLVTVWCQTALFTAANALAPDRAIDTRLALGASRVRLVTELMVGPTLATLVAVPLSGAFAAWMHRDIVTLLPFMAGRRADFGASLLLWSAAGGALFLTAQGLLIVQVVSRRIREARLGGSTRHTVAMPSRLAAVSSGISLFALYIAVLLAASFHRTLNFDYGFDTSGLVAIHTSAMVAGLEDPQAQESRIAALVEHANRLPGVASTVRVNGLPFGTYDVAQDISTVGDTSTRTVVAKVRRTQPGLFELLKVPLLWGRDFRPEEPGTAPVAIVTEQVARALWPSGPAVNSRLTTGDRTYAVVGVVADFSDRAARGVAPTVSPQVFLPEARGDDLLLRTSGNATVLLDSILARGDAYRSFLRVTGFTYEARRESLAAHESAYARFLGLLAWGALLVATLGAFATVGQIARASLKSAAIRLGLGASRAQALSGSIREPLLWLSGGCAAGIGLGLCTGQLLGSSVRNVHSPDPDAVLICLSVSALIVTGSLVGPARLLRHLNVGSLLKENR